MQIPRPAKIHRETDRICFLSVIDTPRSSEAGATKQKFMRHIRVRVRTRGPYGNGALPEFVCLFVWLLGVNCLATIAYLSLEFFVVLVLFTYWMCSNRKATNNNCIIRSNRHTYPQRPEDGEIIATTELESFVSQRSGNNENGFLRCMNGRERTHR